MLEPLILTEGGSPVTVALSSSERRVLSELGIVTLAPTFEDGVFDVTAGRRVGAVTIGERQLVIRPKITDLNRLLFLLGYARDPQVWRDDLVTLEAADDLLPAIAEPFGRLATNAIEKGLLHGYRTIRDTLPVLRGRIRSSEQMNRLYGLPLPLAVEYDDFTVDIAENQLLAMAALRLLTVPRVSEPARRQLQHLRRSLMEVSVPAHGSQTPRWQPSRLNARYQNALRLAEIIVTAESFDHHLGDVAVTGYLFDMWRIFEDFVTAALSEALSRRGWHCETQVTLHLDAEEQVAMRPDLLCRRHGAPTAVVDAKYKAERPEGFPNADLYQMLAYCTVLGLGHGHLVYAKGNESPSSHTVLNAEVTIHCHALDLALEPGDLLRQIDFLATRMAPALVPGPI